MRILIALVVVIVSAILINSFKLALNKLLLRYKLAKRVYKVLPIVELIFWMALMFWIVNFLFEEYTFYNLLVASLMFVAILFVSWYYIRNFIAGIFFRLQNKFIIGDIIQFAEITGNIKKLTSSHLVIEAKEGQVMRIPYSKLSNEIISEHTDLNTFQESKITLKPNLSLGKDQTKEAIVSSILLSPWQKLNRKPNVKFIAEEENHYVFEVNVSTKNEKHLGYLISALKKEFEK
ncbi:MAG: mechanosensitive ion channel family protein [Bacteroidales bacterium]|nr:mechanosensitive ion channel family protein [Bacteroidales bacterium]MCF8456489.1 mechanosensitive ion channel family protein [Bacteroidales bacterium]